MLGTRRRLLALLTVLTVTAAGAPLAAPPQPSRTTVHEVRPLLTRIETNAEQFRRSLAESAESAEFEWVACWETERRIDHFVTRFVDATRRLRADFDRGQVVTAGVDEVLRRGVSIDSFMEHRGWADQATRDWATVRQDLKVLAATFDVLWNPATPRLTSGHADTWFPGAVAGRDRC